MKQRQPIAMAATIWTLVWAASPTMATTYAYDGQGRLKAVNADNNKQTTYTLDDTGNRTQVKGVTGANGAPKANDRSTSLNAGQTFVLHPFTGASPDTDPDGDAMTVVGVTQGQFAGVTFSNNSVTYGPFDCSVTAPDTFTYTIKDAGGLTDSAVVTVTPQGSGPQAVNDTYSVLRNFPIVLTPSPLANDQLGSCGTTSIIALGALTPSDAGSATFTADSVTFQSAPGKTGVVNFGYTIASQGVQSPANIQVTISSANSAPVANYDGTPDSTEVTIGLPGTYTFDPTTNDHDVDSDIFTVTIATQGIHGTAGVNQDGHTITYVPSIDHMGTDSVVYQITDKLGASLGCTTSGPSSCSTVAITINTNQ